MRFPDALQFVLYMVALFGLAIPLGRYMAKVFVGERTFMSRVVGPIERGFYRLAGINAEHEMGWKSYAGALLLLQVVGFLFLYLLQRVQGVLPLNPQHFSSVDPFLSLNTAISFVTNTNWQAYGGETTMSQLTQMMGLGVQNFISAATGIAALIAIIRGFTRRNASSIGNFWVDFTRSVLYILLPLSIIFAVFLVSQGVVQNFASNQVAHIVQPFTSSGQHVTTQTLPMGPAASQIAIKQLGTNGGGFFNVNSAHPYENPTPLSNFLEMLAILLIPAALVFTFGRMIGDRRQAWAIITVMTVIFVGLFALSYASELHGIPHAAALGVNQHTTALQPGGNMEGKEARFGIFNSTFWATATTAASNGSVDAMHDSFTPLGGLAPLVLLVLGEIIFGGVGVGMAGILMHVILAVFVAGLMVGRTPEYLGKKIDVYEMKMAMLAILAPIAAILIGTALAGVLPSTVQSLANPGAHGFSEVLYAFASGTGNNGSAFAGLNANTPFFNIALGLAMLIGRYWTMIPVLAVAGALAKKKWIPPSAGTLPTHRPTFVILLIGVILIVGALSFFPALALGPIADALMH